MLRASSAAIVATLLLINQGVAATNGPIAMGSEFSISESGSFWDKTIKELGTKEAAMMITAACAIFEFDCSKPALAATQAIKTVVMKDDVNGEEHKGIIRAPAGYEICKARIDWKNASIDGETTFNTSIVRTPSDNGLSYYAVVPKHRKEGHWVSAKLYLAFVPRGKTARFGCWPTGTAPWTCKGPDCNNFYKGARL